MISRAKRVSLQILLFIMILSLLPVMAFADSTPTSITITFSGKVAVPANFKVADTGLNVKVKVIKIIDNVETVAAIKEVTVPTSGAVSYSVSWNVAATSSSAVTTTGSAVYILMYDEPNQADILKNAYYISKTEMTPDKAKASRISVNTGIGNLTVTDLDMTLLKNSTVVVPPVVISPMNFDVNKDGKIDQKDLVEIAKRMGSKKKYDQLYDFNKDGVLNKEDLKLFIDSWKNKNEDEREQDKGNGKPSHKGKGKH